MGNHPAKLEIGDALPERTHCPTNVSLFLYNAAVWNAHRIHYDEQYTTKVEGHPAVVIDGPLQGGWLTQVVDEWLDGEGRMVEFEYSNRLAAMLDETLTAGGTVSAIKDDSVVVDLFVRNEDGRVITPGRAVVVFD
ncbi:MAG: hypothetical protein VCB59_03285 [Gammaproteobacteria bacterium]